MITQPIVKSWDYPSIYYATLCAGGYCNYVKFQRGVPNPKVDFRNPKVAPTPCILPGITLRQKKKTPYRANTEVDTENVKQQFVTRDQEQLLRLCDAAFPYIRNIEVY